MDRTFFRSCFRRLFPAALATTSVIFAFSGNLDARLVSKNLGKAPDFALTDQNGKKTSLADLKGHVWIADFIFTRCQTLCPLMTNQMALLEKRLGPSGARFVSFSVDPEHDDPKTLLEYARKYNANADRWVFLTGEKEALWKLSSEGFRLGVDEVSPDEIKAGAQPILHSSHFVLVDREGTIRGFYDSSEPAKLEELTQDAEALLTEKKGNQ